MIGAEPAGPAVSVRSRVEWIDTDAAGIHHNTAIIRYVESAEAELARRLGMDGYFDVAPRVRFEVSYEAPLWFGQEVRTELRVERIGDKSLTFAFEVWGERFEEVPRRRAAAGRYVTVYMPGGVAGTRGHQPGRDDARTKPWPTAWVKALRSGG